MPIEEELKYLLERQLETQLSDVEKSRLAQLLLHQKNRLIMESLIEEVLQERRYSELPGLNKQVLFDNVIMEATRRENRSTTPSFPGRYYSMQKWVSYAAVLLVLAGAGTWFLLKSDELPGRKASRSVSQEVKIPAGNKVMLTLADGSQIALDGIRDSVLSRHTGENIITSNKGEIVYKAGGLLAGTGPMVYNTITTPKGGQYHIILPDNTDVWLNAASSLKFPVSFSSASRTVVLSGEGYFEVAKDASRPFIVKVNDMQVNVLGTHFNVMAYGDENSIKTTLLEGSVKLSQNNINTMLLPGQQGSLSQERNEFNISRPKLQEVIAWKNGEFRFEDTQLESIMRQIARWYDLSVVYTGNFSDITLSGVISRKEKALQLLEILEATHRVHFRMEGNKVFVMPYEKK